MYVDPATREAVEPALGAATSGAGPKKANKAALIAAAVILALVVLGGLLFGGIVLLANLGVGRSPDPASVVNELVSAVSTGDSDTVQKHLVPADGVSDAVSLARSFLGDPLPESAFELESETDTSATVVLGGAPEVMVSMTLEKLDSKWRVTEITRLVSEKQEEPYDADPVNHESSLIPDGEKIALVEDSPGVREVTVTTPHVNGEQRDSESTPGAVVEPAVAPVFLLGTGPARKEAKWAGSGTATVQDLAVMQSIGFNVFEGFGVEPDFKVGAKFTPFVVLPDGRTIEGDVIVNDGESTGLLAGRKTIEWKWTPRYLIDKGADDFSVDTWLPGNYVFITTVDGQTIGWAVATPLSS